MESTGPSLDDCLKLLRGQRDEQKLAGLLLAAKFCQGGDTASVLKVYEAVGARFLQRLLMTGMGKGASGVKSGEEQEAFLRLSITLLAALCRVPEIASSEEMNSQIPHVAEITSTSSDPFIVEECYEFLLLVAAASENGLVKFYESGVMGMLAPHISTLTDGSRSLEFAMQLQQLVVNRLSDDLLNDENLRGMLAMVTSVARQFAVLQNIHKFDALHMLTTLLSSNYIPLHEALRSISTDIWASQIRIGISEILQNRVVSTEKLQALLLADLMMSILGVNWLLEHTRLHHNQEPMPVDKFVLLVLESSRVEVAVLLNELAYLKYEASRSSSDAAGTIFQKQRSLAILFSLMEKIIKLMSTVSGAKGLKAWIEIQTAKNQILVAWLVCTILTDIYWSDQGLVPDRRDPSVKESTLTKMILGLNETIDLVLDFLQDSKDHGQIKGDDLLAAVRIIGSYLAEAPTACKEKTRDLLGYLLSIEGEEESSPFYSVCFLLPMLCQLTVDIDGCKALASVGGHKMIVECLVNMVGSNGKMVNISDRVLLACDTILNLLLNRKELEVWIEGSQFVNLLHALIFWTENCKDPSVVMMASSICSLVFDLTSEESLLNQWNFDQSSFEKLSHLIVRSLNQGEISEDFKDQSDLHQIIISAYCDWADRFPFVRKAVEN
ncbi:uncharacterized protein LOC135616812 isoform X1 [Musa acuminata AAA Group]|uniref:uncharacterized protein LOC103976935 isoform X1 n=1 Tax=Musa acuminata AAA Group TaxID=214697 RepID=UPI0031D5C2D7